MEKTSKPISGFAILLLCLVFLGLAAWFFLNSARQETSQLNIGGIICIIGFVFFAKGLIVVNPNQARVLTFFGKYVGTVKANGLLWVNPFYSSSRISLRSENMESNQRK